MKKKFVECNVQYIALLVLIVGLTLMLGCEEDKFQFSTEIRSSDIEHHIKWLADSTMNGRLAGTPQEAKAANYIADHFRDFGLEPGSDEETFLQSFPLQGPMVQAMGQEGTLSRNVIGVIPGTLESEGVIVIGAHYDGQGNGGIVSMQPDHDDVIHPSADDNASGTSGILELAHYFSEYRPHRTLVFIAFSGEELGLIGSRYFVENPAMPLDEIKAMINLDMIGRMQGDELSVLGTGTMELWEALLPEANGDSLSVTYISSGPGASDHTSFYEKDIPAVHVFTGTHSDYHQSGDTPDKINFDGTESTLRFVRRVISGLDTLSSSEFRFSGTGESVRSTLSAESVTLGVMPDYSFDGEGMRIENVRDGEPADLGGIQASDIIVGLDDQEVGDIFEYMEILSGYEQGDRVRVTIQRDGEELEMNVRF